MPNGLIKATLTLESIFCIKRINHYMFVALNQHATLIGGAQNHKIRETLHKINHTVDTHDFEDNGPPEWYLECEALGHSFSIGKD
jgi:hypothetical protein